MSNDRWLISCHEAGHAVSAVVLGGRCSGLVILPNDGGLAECDQLLGNREAWMTASGPASEILATEHPEPDEPINQQVITLDNYEDSPVFTSSPSLAIQLARPAETRKTHESDERVIALWAIGGHESEPETWAVRVQQAHEMAADIVRHNTAKIVKVATALFVRGCLSESEILELLNET